MLPPLRPFRRATLLALLASAGFGASPAPNLHSVGTTGLPPWSTTASVSTTVGFKDNVLLSAVAPERSTFVESAVEAMLWRLPAGRTDWFTFLNASARRYFTAPSVGHESFAAGFGEWRYQVPGRLLVQFDVRGYFSDRVLDVSDTAVSRLVAPVRVLGANAGPTVRVTLGRGFWAESKASGAQAVYEGDGNNHRATEFAARTGWGRGEIFDVSVGAEERERRYVRRQQYSISGRELEDTRLRVRESELNIQASVAGKRGKAMLRLGSLAFRDNGPGFLDFNGRRATTELEAPAGAWTFSFEGTVARKEFGRQTIGFGVSPPARFQDEISARLRVERMLSRRWTVFAELGWERTRSNDPLDAYRANEGLLGARWNWEK